MSYRRTGLALLLTAFLVLPGTAAASTTRASNHITYKGAGWALSLNFEKSTYRSIRGTLTFSRHPYHVEGDWIPAGDSGGDLLRFYGHPFPNNAFYGLVSVATLYNTCNPNCAAGRTYALTALANWTLPGTQLRSVHLVQQ